MAGADWVKCHNALRKGSKRAIPRASRFVFLELCLEARALDGEIDLRADMAIEDAVHDLLGGDASEVHEAVKDLVTARMVRFEDHDDVRRLVIPSWEDWNRTETSTERSRRSRQRVATHATLQPLHMQQLDRGSAADVSALEERRGDQKRGEERVALHAPPPPPTLKADGSDVRRELAKADDLWPDDDSLTRAAKRIADNVSDPMNRAKGEHVAISREAVQHARTEKGKFPHATPETLLSKAEQKAGWILADFRTGKRQKAGAVSPDKVGSHTVTEDFHEHEQREMERTARETEKRNAEQAPPPSPEERQRQLAALKARIGNGGRAA